MTTPTDYRLLFEENPLPMWVFDLKSLAFLAVNNAAIRAYGYSREEFLSLKITEIRPAADVPGLLHDIDALSYRRPWRHVKKSGEEVQVEISSGNIIFGGKAARLVMAHDITERVKAELHIQKLNSELEQRVVERTAQLEAVNKELEAFSYSVSHDLRAPLRHIAGFIELLQHRANDGLDDQSRHYLATIADSSREMGQLIDDLLSFSRMGRAEMLTGRVDLNGLVHAIIEDVKRDAGTARIVWRIDDLPEAEGDPSMIRVALTNLISNAVKFTRQQDKPEIEISSRNSTADEVVCHVRDNGVGFDMRYVHKLFGVFQRLHSSGEFEGTGIGLATVQRIIHRHGGRTWAVGAPGDGATFYFTLPCRLGAKS